MSRPLSGVRVVDLSSVVMAPWASQMLADMGADVIKVEPPGGDLTRQMGPRKNPGMAAVFLGTNRNKRSVVLDLQHAEGLEALKQLLRGSDALLHNWRPKVAHKLRLRYEDLKDEFPSLVYCAAYGFRKEGPLANEPAYDDIIQAASGMADLMSAICDQPRYVPSIVADKISAYAVCTGMLAALFQKQRTGHGQAVEIAMFESLVDFVMVEHLYGACFDPPIDKMGYSRILTRQRRPYPTQDGYLAVLPYSDANWHDFFRIAGRPELAQDPRFNHLAGRVDHADALYQTVAELVRTRTSQAWIDALQPAQIPVMRVNTKESLLDNEQLHASGFWQTLHHPTEGALRMTDAPIRFSGSTYEVRHAQPRLGEHSVEVLQEAGLSPDVIDSLLARGIARGPTR